MDNKDPKGHHLRLSLASVYAYEAVAYENYRHRPCVFARPWNVRNWQNDYGGSQNERENATPTMTTTTRGKRKTDVEPSEDEVPYQRYLNDDYCSMHIVWASHRQLLVYQQAVTDYCGVFANTTISFKGC